MAVRRIATAAVAAVLCIGVAGCGGDATSADPTPTVTASTTPTPSATGPVAPVLPELAKRNDAVGAKAFVKYWFAAVTYAMKTGDTEPFMAVSAKDCKTCAGLAKRIGHLKAEGGHIEGGGWTAGGMNDGAKRSDGSRIYRVFVEQAQQTLFDKAGKQVSVTARTGFTADALVVWRDGWKTRELARL